MDLGRQMVLLFSRLFEVHFLLIMLTKEFVFSRDTSQAIHFMSHIHSSANYVDLLAMFPGWKYYSIDFFGSKQYKSFRISEKNFLHINRRLNCYDSKYVCIDTLNVIDSYVYMKGKYCLKLSQDCRNYKKNLEIISRTFKLFVPMPLSTVNVNISNKESRFK